MLDHTSDIDMKKLFYLYCDLNNLTIDKDCDTIIDSILQKKYNQIITFHHYGYVFYYLDQLVRGEIDHEQFLTMWDIAGQSENQINPHIYREEHPVYLTTLTPEIVSSWMKNDLVIIDQLVLDYYLSQYGEVKSEAKIIVL